MKLSSCFHEMSISLTETSKKINLTPFLCYTTFLDLFILLQVSKQQPKSLPENQFFLAKKNW